MFRRSRIKITPKIPQAKNPATESIDPTKSQQQQQQQPNVNPNGPIQGVNDLEPITISPTQSIPNNPPTACPTSSIMNQSSCHGENETTIIEIISTGSHSPPSPSNFATPVNVIGDSTISVDQTTGSQLNQGSSEPVTSRSSQPPPTPPSNPPSSSSSSGGTSVVGTLSRPRVQSISRESLPPPPPPPPPSQAPSSGTTVDEDAPVNDHIQSRKRIRLTPEDLLDRNSITIFHLIHGSISRTKKKPKEKKTNQSTDSDAGSKDLENEEEVSNIENDEASIIESDETSNIENDETPNIENDDSMMVIGPRVKVGPDGQIIIDEESLVIKKTKPVETTSVEESVSGKTTYASFRKRPPTARWSKTETIEFYTALNLIGPDFSLMSTLFFNGKRTRTDLKNKFRRENKLNQPVIEKALYEADVDYCLARVAS